MNVFSWFNIDGSPASEVLASFTSAVLRGDTEKIRELVGANPKLLNWADDERKTPLHWAARQQCLDSILCLVSLGADTGLKGRLGYTAKDIALWHGEGPMGYYSKVCRKIVAAIDSISPRESIDTSGEPRGGDGGSDA